MNNPLISVIVPCYNQARYLDECLQSVFDQTFINWECIIINDGSLDNTKEIVERWLTKDCRFKYLVQSNKGVSAARNHGILEAKGKWILPLDGDDKITVTYLEEALPFLITQNKVVYGIAEFFGNLNGIWNLEDYSLEKLAKFNMIHVSAFYKKNDFNAIGGYDTNMKYGLEDWEFYINLLKNGGNVMQIKKVGLLYRIQDVSRTSELKEERKKEMLRYLEKKHFDFFYDHLGSKISLKNEIDELNSRYRGRLYKLYNLLIDMLFKIRSK